MKTDEVPQDPTTTYGGVRKLLYAVDDKGEYEGVRSQGWDVENYVTQAAVAELTRQAEEALARARAGQTSALEYHMFARRMDVATLSATTGVWAWRVKRHFKPSVFARLSEKMLARYAFAMGVTVDELRHLPAPQADV
ncbi:MAG TPA: hypothetical protein PLS69_08970 [Terricaulis sp.]|nr:hypothetical protein [Terricaulis sp.]